MPIAPSDLFGSDDTIDQEFDPRDDLDLQRIVFPATVIVDTQEQMPFHFLNIDPYTAVPIRHEKLKTGDYSVAGHELVVTLERKSISDFVSSFTVERERLKREFERMEPMEFAAVIVEGELSDVLQYARDKTQVNIQTLVGTINSWAVRYGVHFIFCMGRRHCEITALKLLHNFLRGKK